MTILVTGSSGKTSSRLSPLLPASHPPLVASRGGKPVVGGYPSVRFDWLDPSTYGLPFEHEQVQKSPITAVYIVAPPVIEAVDHVEKFVTYAQERGVKRFVLLSAASLDSDGPMLGEIHRYLKDRTEEWGVVRPSWFMENFSEAQHYPTIKYESKIYTATCEGKVPFISAQDIAAVAARLLVDEKPHNTDYVLTGPALLTYGDVANEFSEILGRKIEHVNLSPEAMIPQFQKGGLSVAYAKLLTDMDVEISKGSADYMTDIVERVTGRKPKTLREFITEGRQCWIRNCT